MLAVSGGALADGIEWAGLEDPRIKDALFESYRKRHFLAITRLQLEQKLGRTKKNQKVASLVLGGMYLDYGFHQEASLIFDALLDKDQPRAIRDQVWFALAKTQYQAGRQQQALATLSRIEALLPIRLQAERLIIESIILIGEKRYRDAVAVLNKLDSNTDWWLYGRYNLGVALYKSGKTDEGIRILDNIGELSSDDQETQNLKDKANLVLAYRLLNDKKPAQAEIYLKRMRINGPHSNAALLGLGRAYAAQQRHKDSLVPWLELITRDPSDPAVQDGLMAAPAALGELNAYQQALDHYEKALAIFQKEITRLNSAADAIGSGQFIEGLIRARSGESVAGIWTERNVLDTPEGKYLWPIVATHEFQKTLFYFTQLRISLGKLERWSSSIDSYEALSERRRMAYKNRITQLQQQVLLASKKLNHHLRRLAYDELQRRKKRLVGYYNEARFSVARVYDYAAKRWGNK